MVKYDDEEEQDYDIIAQSKKKLAKKVREQKESIQLGENVMTQKNRKLQKVIKHVVAEKRAVAENYKEKAEKLKKK